MKRICVFCGSSAGKNPNHLAAAHAFGRLLVARGLELVYGGGGTGIMGRVSATVMAAGGRAIGVIPDFLNTEGIAASGISDMHVVATMHERKQLMAELSDAFVALPGGVGTMEEILEAITWNQLRLQHKPCGFLNVDGYYDRLIGFFGDAQADGFLGADLMGFIRVEATPDALLAALESYSPPPDAQLAVDAASRL